MKHHILGSTAVCVLALPAMASEFAFSGAEFSATGYYNSYTTGITTDDWVAGTLATSVQFDFMGGAFAQFDGALEGYNATPALYDVGASIGKHFGFEYMSGHNAGVFGAADFWEGWPGTYTLGAEIAGDTGDFTYEAYGAYQTDLDTFPWYDFQIYHLDAKGAYKLDNGLSLGVGAHYADIDLGGRIWQAKANVSYEFTDDLAVEGGYVYTDSNFGAGLTSHGVNLTLTKKIGGGTTFGERNTTALLSGLRF